MEKQEGARGTERWNRSEREREGEATLASLFLHHSSERFHRSVFPGLPWSSLVLPRFFLFFFFPLYLFRYS